VRAPRFLPLRAVLAVLVLPGVAAVLVPAVILSSGLGVAPKALGGWELAALAVGGIAVFLLGSCVWIFFRTGGGTLAPVDPPRRMVVAGAYRFSRNPMYLGVVVLAAAEALFYRSWALAVYAAILLLVFHLFVVFYEEPALRRRFGKSYVDYVEGVPRWMPRPASKRAPAAEDQSGS
jgi:protein-S-isoprenylcysteine O-methyltransferase Ste14